MLKRIKENGISLRALHGLLVVIALIVSCLLIVATYRASSLFVEISRTTDEFVGMRDAAEELMEGSDYLTEMVQRYTLNGDITFLNRYFDEAFNERRRDDAIEKMSASVNEKDALERLSAAMKESQTLMERECYAMKLVLEAKGEEDYPDILRNIPLKEADMALSAPKKMSLAHQMVFDEAYYTQKDRIRANMKASVEKLVATTHSIQQKSQDKLRRQLQTVRFVIIVQTLSILFMIWLTAQLGINPVLKAVDRIRNDSPIPVIGANEFRYLAKTYNKMYTMYKNSVSSLSFKASHDALTKVYNRSGYDLLLTSIDIKTTCMILIDIDFFKNINDTFGHEAGDEVIKKVAQVITGQFRSDDYVCRIGGDEFVVFMVHTGRKQMTLVTTKVKRINETLKSQDGDLPPVTISAGIAFGEDAATPKELFEHADQALYETKRSGRCGASIYRQNYRQ